MRTESTAPLERLISFYIHATHAGERLLYPHRKPVDIGEPPPDCPIPRFTDDTSTLNWFDTERECLLAAQAEAKKHGWKEFVWKLAWTLHGYLWRTGHLNEQPLPARYLALPVNHLGGQGQSRAFRRSRIYPLGHQQGRRQGGRVRLPEQI